MLFLWNQKKLHFGIKENHKIKLSFISKCSSTINYISTMNACFGFQWPVFYDSNLKKLGQLCQVARKKKKTIWLCYPFNRIIWYYFIQSSKGEKRWLSILSQHLTALTKNMWTSLWPLLCFQSKCNESFLMVEKV